MGMATVVSMFNFLIIRVRLPFHVLTYNYFYTFSDRENWENQNGNFLEISVILYSSSILFMPLIETRNLSRPWNLGDIYLVVIMNLIKNRNRIDELKNFQKWSMECIRSTVHRNIDYALRVFNRLVEVHRLFSIEDFNDMFGRIARLKYYSKVITLIKQMELIRNCS